LNFGIALPAQPKGKQKDNAAMQDVNWDFTLTRLIASSLASKHQNSGGHAVAPMVEFVGCLGLALPVACKRAKFGSKVSLNRSVKAVQSHPRQLLDLAAKVANLSALLVSTEHSTSPIGCQC
jgi:hypothetical protein